jgi:hypothetical protein
MAEVWVVLYAVIFIKEMRMFDIILEGDVLHIVNTLNSDN